MYCLSILYCENDDLPYIGYTKDLRRKLIEHNNRLQLLFRFQIL